MNQTREEWLNASLPELQSRVFGSEWTIPAKVKISCGFPRGRHGKGKAIGQCWNPEASADMNHEIFICPTLSDSSRVLDVLCHELIHAIVGTKEGHKGAFKRCAKAIGLTGKMTATVAGPELSQSLLAIVADIGTYPHAEIKLGLTGIKKQSTRMVKVLCKGCGYTIRTTHKWLETGTPTCPCGGAFE